MSSVLFFDADELLENFIAAHPLKAVKPVFFRESLNTVSPEKLIPYADSEIISCFTHSEKIPNQKLDYFPKLKLIATRTTGYNHIDLSYCHQRHISISNVPAYGAKTVAEFAFTLLLALSRKLIRAKNDMAHNKIDTQYYMGFDLAGKTIGIIGTGSIGQHMIKLAEGFDMNIIAYDSYPNPTLKKYYTGTLAELYRQSDIISLHIPSTAQNYHLLNQDAFNLMKRGVIIINTARGDLIDTQALYSALYSGMVGGAGLDVLENEDFLLHDEVILEPRQHSSEFLLDSAMNLKLMQFQNVITTPHIAFNSIDAIDRINQTTLNNISEFLKNKPVNLVQ